LKRIALVVAALAVVAFVVGCGGGESSSSSSSSGTTASSGEPSKAEYVESADAVCTEYQGASASLRKEAEEIEGSANPESPKNLARFAEILREADAIADKEYAALKEVEPPSADKALIDSIIGKSEEAESESREAAEALEEGDLSKFSEILNQTAPLNNQAKGMAEGYGFKVCGQAE
jgi:ABC-type phosphate/phosphonate transport system substrate-binding protein